MNGESIRAAEGPGVGRRSIPWGMFLLVWGAFLLIEHDGNAPATYQQLISSQSIEEFEGISSMFEQRATRQVGALALGLVGAAGLLVWGRSGKHRITLLAIMMLIFLSWNILSMTWADSFGMTFRRLIMFILLCLGAATVAERFSVRHIALFTLLSSGLYLLLGIINEAIAKSYQFSEPWYRFSGTLHPNAQAINCALLLFAALALWPEAGRAKVALLAVAAVAFAFLYLTKSRTALASSVAVVAMQWGIVQPKSRKVAVVSAAIAGVCLIMLLGNVVMPLLRQGVQMGRQEEAGSTKTLTGRTALWKQCAGYVQERPVLGYGYGGFWNTERSMAIIEEQGWPISHAHNAYMDIQLEAGPVAVAAYVAILFLGILQAIVLYRGTWNRGYAFLAVVLLFCAVNGLLESVAIQRTSLTFLSMVILIKLGFHRLPEQEDQAVLETKAPAPSHSGFESVPSMAATTTGIQ